MYHVYDRNKRKRKSQLATVFSRSDRLNYVRDHSGHDNKSSEASDEKKKKVACCSPTEARTESIKGLLEMRICPTMAC